MDVSTYIRTYSNTCKYVTITQSGLSGVSFVWNYVRTYDRYTYVCMCIYCTYIYVRTYKGTYTYIRMDR